MEMTQEWIAQFNKKCAEFLGWKPNKHNNGGSDDFYDNPQIYSSDLKFHSDWNWIMEVVDRIENTKTTDLSNAEPFVTIRLVGCDIKFYNKERLPILTNAKTKKEAVIQAIDQFIDWYNKEKE